MIKRASITQMVRSDIKVNSKLRQPIYILYIIRVVLISIKIAAKNLVFRLREKNTGVTDH